MSDCNKAKNGTLQVRQLQRTLYLKSKQSKEVRFYSLYDKIYRADVLWEAWRQVKSNQGAAGIDGKSISDVIEEGEAKIINKLQEQLRAKLYTFTSSRQVEIPKAKGGTRPLEIMTVEDRIVLTAIKIVIEPVFEADFHECSYGYRPKRGAKQASVSIREDLYQGSAWGVVEIDFQSYFTRIPHEKLLKLIGKRIADGSMLKIIKQTLITSVSQQSKITNKKVGVPQGSPISPLYSNIYLNVIDQVWHSRGYPEKLSATLHRYCDDAILVCRKSCQYRVL